MQHIIFTILRGKLNPSVLKKSWKFYFTDKRNNFFVQKKKEDIVVNALN